MNEVSLKSVVLVGVNHFDPLQRGLLVKLLEALRDEMSYSPEFVALEYDEAILGSIIAQRSAFRTLLQEEWHDLTEDELDLLEMSLGYDGDTHLAVFPDTPTVWLDSGRMLPPHLASDGHSYAKGRIRTYRSHLRDITTLHQNLDVLSRRSRNVADPSMIDLARSRLFAVRLIEAINLLKSGWILSILGSGHVDAAILGSTAAILIDRGIKVRTLRNDP